MYNQKTKNDASPASVSGIAAAKQPSYQKTASDPVTAAIQEYRMVYPEVFYKLQPYIMMVCDQMDAYNGAMPNQNMLDQMSDNIYSDMMEMYPDMSDYVREQESRAGDYAETITRRPYYGRRFRRRGLFRDLIDILLLSEFHRRRRRRYY